MQKDFHFYLTYGLARKAGIKASDAEIIAWADQYTDEVKDAALHGLQTQCPVEIKGSWEDPQIQMSVLVPFHFIPGDDQEHPWKTTRDSQRAKGLVESGMKRGPIHFGIALHTYQDSYSHENFSGCREELNSCFPWYYLESALPNVGHAEMRAIPDVLHYIWTDPRTGNRVNNTTKALAAAKQTYEYLVNFAGNSGTQPSWSTIRKELEPLFKLTDYDKRVTGLCKGSGNSKVDFKNVNQKLESELKDDFVKAASSHLADAMKSFDNLPWLS